MTLVGDIFNNQRIEERLRQTADYAKRELYPKRSPKMRAKILWELPKLERAIEGRW